MKNWQNSDEFKRIQAGMLQGEKITMPDIATGAFKLIKDGKPYKLQLRDGQYEIESLRIHKKLLGMGWDLPKIEEIRNINGKIFTLTEWIPGETGLELRERLGRLPEDYYYKLGVWISNLHNTKIDGLNVSVLNYWPRNTLIREDGSIIYLDLNKLYLTSFPEAFIEKCIVAETPSVDLQQASAFLRGYRTNRDYDFKKIIKWHIENIFRQYHDIYLDGELFYKGARPFIKRWEMMNLPLDMKDFYVLDLGYAGGMFSLECAKRGAKRIYACDNWYKNIGPAHHRLSDMGKLISVYHGFTEDTLVYKHIDINTDSFIENHIPDTLNYIPKKKYDIVFALAVADHLDQERKPKFFKMLSEITDCLYYESRMGGRRELEEDRLRKLTTFDKITYLGNASDNQHKFTYSMFKCERSGNGSQ